MVGLTLLEHRILASDLLRFLETLDRMYKRLTDLGTERPIEVCRRMAHLLTKLRELRTELDDLVCAQYPADDDDGPDAQPANVYYP